MNEYTCSIDNVKKYTPSDIKNARKLAHLYNWYGVVYPTQQFLANSNGIHRSTVKLSVKKFKRDGLYIVTTKVKQPCLYQPGPLLADIKYRDRLSNIIPELKGFPVFNLISMRESSTNSNIQSYVKYEHVKSHADTWDEFWFYESKRSSPANLRMAVQEFSKKRERVTKMIPHYIDAITEFALSHEEKLQLAVYSERVINKARGRVKAKTDLKDPKSYFKKACLLIDTYDGSDNPSFPVFVKKGTPRQAQSSRQPSKRDGQPIERKQAPTQHDYDVIKYKYLEYLLKMTTNPQAKQRLVEQLQQQAIKLEQPQPTPQSLVESWSKPLDELQLMKAEGLARIKDEGLRQFLGSLFDHSVKQHWKPQNEIVKEDPFFEDIRFTETIENTSIMPAEVEVGEDDYDNINTHLLF